MEGEPELSMGTSIVAVEFQDGVVLGADSRTTTGVYIANRGSNKLTRLAERIYVCRSGSAADTQTVAEYVEYYLRQHRLALQRDPHVATAARLVRSMCYYNKDFLSAGIICAGWDEKEKGAVYSIPLGGALVKQPFAIGGSGSTYVYGWVDANFNPGMTREEAEQFVRTALRFAMGRDGSSGGVIRTVTVTQAGAETAFVPGNEIPV